ncbi:putative AP2-like ethylene-responsive transcription factor SNZ [Nannochloris sp. 'desiccata']|nr:hypothetical protein KSW81_005638 [Chlorella desiccata (nom. nud.)]KAH7623457.1 putative AP2-like ethylene-responsive transcription factor SNZ [Chlorella desiccata (nom. nud.)]
MLPEGLGGAPPPPSQNAVASSRSQTGFTGVTLHKRTQRYEAHIWAEKKQIYLGSYNIKSQAARVHDIMALKIGKAPVVGDDSGSNSSAGNGGEINYPLEDYTEMKPLLSSISQHDLVVTLRNYGKSLNASGYPNLAASAFASAPSTSAVAPSAPSSKIPINLPPQHQLQLQANSIPPLTRASSLPDDRRARKRKQERPSSALDNPQWHAEEPVAGISQRVPSASLPLDLPRPSKLLGRAGSGPAPFPLFHAARQQQQVQQQSKNDLACNLGNLPHPPPLQLGPLEVQPNQQAGLSLPAAGTAAVGGTNHHYRRTARKRENEA